MSKSVLDAFVEQTYGGYDGIKIAQDEADAKEAAIFELQKDNVKKAMEFLHTSHNIADDMDIPTVLQQGSLDQIPVPHDNMKGNDHSLDMDRTSLLREKYMHEQYGEGAVFEVPLRIEMEDSTDTKMVTDAYENIDPTDVPDLSGIFNDSFGL